MSMFLWRAIRITFAAVAVSAVPARVMAAGPVTLIGHQSRTYATLPTGTAAVTGHTDFHITSPREPAATLGRVNLIGPDAWLFLDQVIPSRAATATYLAHVTVAGEPAVVDRNVRIAQCDTGSVVIPQPPDFAAITAFSGRNCSGPAMPFSCFQAAGEKELAFMARGIRSFRLKRGYTATIAQKANGSGYSQNFVAADGDLEVALLPTPFDRTIQFIRVFPWRWTPKKGVAGNIWQNLNVGWYYDWNIAQASSPDLEYVPIKQKRWWPPLDQDWRARGSSCLLGYNEPDHADQSNLTVADAIAAWPDLLATGLRLGSPGVSDGGLNWLYDFIDRADAAHLRVDFVAVHYYRAYGNPNDPKGAAEQFYRYLKGIHDRTHRPIWITEFNNGANWTDHRPTVDQERAAIAAFMKMLDETPFVERYAIYNWVEDVRNVQRNDGSLTPAGQVYKDDVAPIGYRQALP